MNWYKTSQAYKEPWKMTQQEYMDYHYTGGIESSAYEDYRTVEGLDWIKKENKPILEEVKDFGGYQVEFRKTGNKLKYVKHDENDDILRDEHGLATYLSQQEMIDQKLPLEDQTIYAFVGDDPIGFASNEWGATGVWVVEKYQKLGIGTHLLAMFRKTMRPESKMGQMTNAGYGLAQAYHKRLVEEAINEDKPVPDEVLLDYPKLIGKEEDGAWWAMQIKKNPKIYDTLDESMKINPTVVQALKEAWLKIISEMPAMCQYLRPILKNDPDIQKACQNYELV